MFNQSKQVRFKEILETLGCTEEHLKYSITPLLYTKERFLANKGPDGKGKKELNDDGTPAPVTWDSLAHEDFLAPCVIKQPKRRQVYPALKPLPPGANTPKAQDPQVKFFTLPPIILFPLSNQWQALDEDVKAVIKERELKMQLALVRVMKARNTLMVNQLIAEATEQLSKYFVPEVFFLSFWSIFF